MRYAYNALRMSCFVACSFTYYSYAAIPHQLYPPERIACRPDANQLVLCKGFDHAELRENTIINFSRAKEHTLIFSSAVAIRHFASSEIYFTYFDGHREYVQLTTNNTALFPDLYRGAWQQIDKNRYQCNGGYMTCLLTSSSQFPY